MKVLVTGGAGFIGTNLSNRLISRGDDVTVLDNLSRPLTDRNIAWLRDTHGSDSFRFVQADVRDYPALLEAARGADVIYHLAGQTTVTTSVSNPRNDFESNALGTFNALEAARAACEAGANPVFLYTSTNKVYGGMAGVAIETRNGRYAYRDYPDGIDESYPLDFHSPYGCSKGTGDQYVRDYARIYNLRTIVVRQSSIYGYRQFGMEDQGWIAWLSIAAVTGRPITIYGDGKQVRDVLFIDDLLDLYDAAARHANTATGQLYNVGGGTENTLSIWTETGPLLERLTGHPLPVTYAGWRPGDQRVYVSNISKARNELGWSPKIGVEEGVNRLFAWISNNKSLFE
ncbi:MAG: GDP-mannose 4,6-dehydratase [Chloroflexi bacterium]|nr:GDP-mannose 4,6-dehydratase [Chloroflexota bacterium]MCL5274316.1 GDP-mannose 4,6-dehydratase [Chloroflexota bacterium]